MLSFLLLFIQYPILSIHIPGEWRYSWDRKDEYQKNGKYLKEIYPLDSLQVLNANANLI